MNRRRAVRLLAENFAGIPPYARIVMLVAATAVPSTASAAWPTHRHDPARSGVTDETLTPPLTQAWVYESKYPPQPAWHGPARRDGWHKTENLKPRVIFDWAFHVVADDESVYFGSSADDKVTCLDTRTGKQRWGAFTDAPIRLAPTLHDGKVYVGSDDGVVYCLSARDGTLVWRHRPAARDYRVAGNERIMSVWPIRSGVVVDGDVAYYCAGLFAFEGGYLCAVNVRDGSEIWKRRFAMLCPQGYMLASRDRLYVPAGGGPPGVFDRQDGRFLYTLDGAGGTFAVLSDEALIYGPGKVGTLEAFKAGTKDQIAAFAGNQIVVTPKMSYLHTDSELSALDRTRYLALCDQRTRLERRIEAQKKLLKKNNRDIGWDPENAFYIGTYKDDDEFFAFKGEIAEVRVWNVARDAAAIAADMNRMLSDKPKGLVGYWRLDEGSGENVADSAGQSMGKLVKGPQWVQTDSNRPGPPAHRALAFDGSTTYIDAGKDPGLKLKRTVTIEAWIKPFEREKWSGIAGKLWDSGSVESGYDLALDDGSGVYFGLKVGAFPLVYLSSGPNTVALDQWHHVAGTYDGSTMKVCVDGVLKASKLLFEGEEQSREVIARNIREMQTEVSKLSKELPSCIGWKRPCTYPYSLILAGDVLYAGGTNGVAAFSIADGKTIWTEKVSGRALDLAVAGGRLLVSTDQGVIHCFTPK